MIHAQDSPPCVPSPIHLNFNLLSDLQIFRLSIFAEKETGPYLPDLITPARCNVSSSTQDTLISSMRHVHDDLFSCSKVLNFLLSHFTDRGSIPVRFRQNQGKMITRSNQRGESPETHWTPISSSCPTHMTQQMSLLRPYMRAHASGPILQRLGGVRHSVPSTCNANFGTQRQTSKEADCLS